MKHIIAHRKHNWPYHSHAENVYFHIFLMIYNILFSNYMGLLQ